MAARLPKRLRIRPRAPLVTPLQVTTAAPGLVRPRGYSGESMLSRDEQMTEAAALSVVMAQPHRAGVSSHPNDAWQASALGRFCLRHWMSKEGQEEHWQAGEDYARRIDAERIARGFTPRQCAVDEPGEPLSEDARRKLIAERAKALADAEAVLGAGDIWAVRRLAYDDLDLPPGMERDAYFGLHALAVYFARENLLTTYPSLR